MKRPMPWLLRLLSSYGLGIVILVLMMVLVVLGTLYQAEFGLYRAQQLFYNSYFLVYPLGNSGLAVPLPGALLLMGLLFVNLLLATLLRMKPRRRVMGVYIVHVGILVLLAGGFFTVYGSSEGMMTIHEGAANNFSERSHERELAIVADLGPNREQVTVFRHLAGQAPGTVLHRANEALPFDVELVAIYRDAILEAEPSGAYARQHGVNHPFSRRFMIQQYTARMTGDNYYLAGIFRFTPAAGEPIVCLLGDRLPMEQELAGYQTFEVDGREYRVDLRPRRDYYPFSIYLEDFQQDLHPNTGMAASYSSDVILLDPEAGVERNVRIYMNNPLRYGMRTFYQASFGRDERSTVLQVVQNRGLLFPYIAMIVIGVGLTWQFLTMLVSRARLQRQLAAELAQAAQNVGAASTPRP